MFRNLRAAAQAGPFTYEQVDQLLGRRQSRRLPGRYTTLIRTARGSIAVKLVNTNVVEWFRCGRIRLDSGGWRTVTTKQRISTYAPVAVWSHRGSWLCGGLMAVQAPVPFVDGMDWKNGRVLGA